MDNFTACEEAYKNGYNKCLEDIRSGTIEEENKADWIEDDIGIICPRCGNTFLKSFKNSFNYCPICGKGLKKSG